MGYAATVVVFTIKATNNGHQAWKSSVKELSWSGGGGDSAEMRGIPPSQPPSHHGYPASGSQASQQLLSPSYSPQYGNMPHPSTPIV
jgi:hypothetical protein